MRRIAEKTWLSRIELAECLTAAGYPVSTWTLSSIGYKGRGPQYELFSRKARYRWGYALEWANSRMKPGGRREPQATSTDAQAA